MVGSGLVVRCFLGFGLSLVFGNCCVDCFGFRWCCFVDGLGWLSVLYVLCVSRRCVYELILVVCGLRWVCGLHAGVGFSCLFLGCVLYV